MYVLPTLNFYKYKKRIQSEHCHVVVGTLFSIREVSGSTLGYKIDNHD
jgi:hypothetical protein